MSIRHLVQGQKLKRNAEFIWTTSCHWILQLIYIAASFSFQKMYLCHEKNDLHRPSLLIMGWNFHFRLASSQRRFRRRQDNYFFTRFLQQNLGSSVSLQPTFPAPWARCFFSSLHDSTHINYNFTNVRPHHSATRFPRCALLHFPPNLISDVISDFPPSPRFPPFSGLQLYMSGEEKIRDVETYFQRRRVSNYIKSR